MGSFEQGFITRLGTWAAAPITTQMDIWDVVLTTILVATVGCVWLSVLSHLTSGDI